MDLIDRDEKRGTRSESREGTRWMGKHVGVDFVDSTHPSVRQLDPTPPSFLYPFLRPSGIPLLTSYHQTRYGDTTHEIGGLAATL